MGPEQVFRGIMGADFAANAGKAIQNVVRCINAGDSAALKPCMTRELHEWIFQPGSTPTSEITEVVSCSVVSHHFLWETSQYPGIRLLAQVGVKLEVLLGPQRDPSVAVALFRSFLNPVRVVKEGKPGPLRGLSLHLSGDTVSVDDTLMELARTKGLPHVSPERMPMEWWLVHLQVNDPQPSSQ